MNIFRTFGGDSDRPSLLSSEAKVGEMNFAFIDMGQGDCTIISAPDNSVYIVDCGSSGGLPEASFAEARKIVRSWAGSNNVKMIMTHPDKDHYNKFLDLLVTTDPVVKVDTIYFSRAKTDKMPWGYYKETALMRNIQKFGKPMIVEVTLNDTSNSQKKWLYIYDMYTVPFPSDIPATGLVLASGKTPKDKNWSISIIAGNVKTTASSTSSTASNVVSLCTLAQLDTDKLLLTGDSTAETLDYLYAKQKENIKNVSIFQVPHHGSESSVPSSGFVDLVNPETALVSVGLLNSSYNLPRMEVMNAWLGSKRIREQERHYDYWTAGAKGYTTFKDLQNIIDVKWKGYSFDKNTSGTFVWLLNPDDAVKSGTGFYGFSNDGYFLYRAVTPKDLYQTGINGSLYDQDFFDPTELLKNI